MWARVVDRKETPETQPGTGPQGPPGPKGDTGATGPQGPPGTGGTGGVQFLSGNRAPFSGSGLFPLDGINDPWRWFPPMTGWVGPAYSVTWQTGDRVGLFPIMPDTNEEYALWIGAVTTPTEANNNPGDFYASETTDPETQPAGAPTTTPTSNIFVAQGNGVLVNGRTPRTLTNSQGVAIADGSGIAFLFQAERGWTGPTAVPDPTFNDLATILGPDVVLGEPYTFDEVGDGNDGDFWFDKSAMLLYGPKAGGVWPAGVNIKGFDSEATHFLHAGLNLGPMTYPGEPALTIADGTPDIPGYMGPGQVAVWYDATAGAPAVHVTGLDAAGTQFDRIVGGDQILASPGGTQYRLVVSDDGTLSTEAV